MLRRSARAWISWDLETVGPAWLQWVWTLLFAVAIALGFTLFGMAANASRDPSRWLDLALWGRWYRVNFTISLTISLLIHLLFAIAIPSVGKARIGRMTHGRRAVFFTAIPISGVVVGWPLGMWLVGQNMAQWIHIRNPAELLSSAVLSILISFIIFLFFNARARQMMAEKRATEAQLRLLQGQIEPHFLFNTLANVQTLIEHEPVKARQTLEAFTDYLRASLGGLRKDKSTLGDELDLARAYLELIQARMGERLQFTIEADAGLRALPMPALLIQPLVENAIHHGLEPQVDGGMLRIQARIGTATRCASRSATTGAA